MIAPPPPRCPARPAPVALAALALALLAPRAARANMAKAILDGERYGALVPDGATALRVDREQLSFLLARDLHRAAVTAAYRLTNTGAGAEAADVAFVYVRGDLDDSEPAARAAIEADGAPLHFHAVTAVDLLAARLHTWIEAHAEVARALKAAVAGAGTAPLRGLVEAAGGDCGADGCSALVTWYRSTSGDEDHRLSDWREEHRLTGWQEDDATVGAAREVLPGAAAEVARGWSTLAGREGSTRLGFLLFHLDVLPGQTRSVTVHYEHRAEVDRQAYVNDTFGFDYLLSPARRWAGFGPLDIAIRVPGRTRFASPLPFRREGDTYRAELPGLPDGELRFQVTSLDGLWLGMIRPDGYWAILAGAMAATAFAVGGATGRRRPGAPWWKRALLPLVTGGPLAAACNVAVLVLLLAAFPTGALGFGYGGILGGALMVALSVPAGAAASVVWAAYRGR